MITWTCARQPGGRLLVEKLNCARRMWAIEMTAPVLARLALVMCGVRDREARTEYPDLAREVIDTRRGNKFEITSEEIKTWLAVRREKIRTGGE